MIENCASSSMNINNIVPEMLNETNYADWSVKVRTYLQAQDIWDVIEEETRLEEIDDKIAFKAWRRRNAAALYAIHVSCDARAFSLIRDISSAKIAWYTLAEKFSTTHKDERERVPGWEIKPESTDRGQSKISESKEISGQIPSNNSFTAISGDLDLGTFFDAARYGDLSVVKHFLKENPDVVRAIHPFYNQTALHIASISGRFCVVEELVSKMREEDLEIRAANGYTALAISTISGDTRIAECMVRRNKRIVSVPDDILEFIPLEFALLHGHKAMSRYLYSVTPLEALLREEGKHGATVITYCIYLQCYEIAFDLLRRCPSLTVASDHWGASPVYALTLSDPSAFRSGCGLRFWEQWIYDRIPVKQYDHEKSEISIQVRNLEVSQAKPRKFTCSRIQHIYDLKLTHFESSTLLKHFCKVIRELDIDQVKKALVDKALHESAARGIDEFFSAVLRANPELIRSTEEGSGQSVFMKAVEFRQPKIFCLIHGTASKKAWTSMVDHSGNTMLHMAGLLAPPNQLSKIPGAALQMQRELQWFKEVETIILPHHLELRNSSGHTARELFTKTHKDLMTAGEKWMKDTASSCSLVGSLIATIMFAVAFTVPGGSDQATGFPIFSERKLFKIFIVSDGISLFSSTASVLMFLGILTSRYAEQDFLKSLPTKLVIGLFTLFFSITTMTVAFCAALFLVLRCELWFVVPILSLAMVPVTLFGWMQFPLLIQIFYSTYGPSIFDRNVEHWL